MENNVIVSICMIAYNHEAYIKQAIEGVLMQECNFDYELVIGEDCSLDATRDICIYYASNHKQIRLLNNEVNIGVMPNFIKTLQACRGKYIALCEGDDYWTDPLKLKKQVDFLEENPEYVMSFHKIGYLVNGEIKGSYYKGPSKSTLYCKDIILKHYIPTCSLVFKNDSFKLKSSNWLYKSKIGDIPLEIIVSSQGLTYYYNEVMGVYRKNTSSVTHSKTQKKEGRRTYIFVYSNLINELRWSLRPYLYLKILMLKIGFIKDWLNMNKSLRKI